MVQESLTVEEMEENNFKLNENDKQRQYDNEEDDEHDNYEKYEINDNDKINYNDEINNMMIQNRVKRSTNFQTHGWYCY